MVYNRIIADLPQYKLLPKVRELVSEVQISEVSLYIHIWSYTYVCMHVHE